MFVGSAAARAGLRRDDVYLVVIAADASPRTEQRVVRLAEVKGIPVVVGPDAAELGRRVGRPGTVQAVGVSDRHMAAGISSSLLQQEEKFSE